MEISMSFLPRSFLGSCERKGWSSSCWEQSWKVICTFPVHSPRCLPVLATTITGNAGFCGEPQKFKKKKVSRGLRQRYWWYTDLRNDQLGVGDKVKFFSSKAPNYLSHDDTPQWGAADAEIKVPSGENTDRSPFKAWSRSVYSHTCHT